MDGLSFGTPFLVLSLGASSRFSLSQPLGLADRTLALSGRLTGLAFDVGPPGCRK